MANKKKKKDEKKSEFDLLAPSSAASDDSAELSPSSSNETSPPRPRARADESLKQMTWRGFEEPDDEVDPDPGLNFTKKGEEQEDGMDMTPMVDVTFLLLIFFMVTASFSLQRSIQQPPSQVEEPSLNVTEDVEDEDDYVEVIVDQNDIYYVTTRDENEVETPSETQMRAKIRNAIVDYGAKRLMITAHVDSTHERVIKVWDAGIAANLDRIEMKTTELEY